MEIEIATQKDQYYLCSKVGVTLRNGFLNYINVLNKWTSGSQTFKSVSDSPEG